MKAYKWFCTLCTPQLLTANTALLPTLPPALAAFDHHASKHSNSICLFQCLFLAENDLEPTYSDFFFLIDMLVLKCNTPGTTVCSPGSWHLGWTSHFCSLWRLWGCFAVLRARGSLPWSPPLTTTPLSLCWLCFGTVCFTWLCTTSVFASQSHSWAPDIVCYFPLNGVFRESFLGRRCGRHGRLVFLPCWVAPWRLCGCRTCGTHPAASQQSRIHTKQHPVIIAN